MSSYVWAKDSQSIVFQTTKPEEEEKKEEFPQPIVVEKTTYRFDGGTFLPNDELTQIKKSGCRYKRMYHTVRIQRIPIGTSRCIT